MERPKMIIFDYGQTLADEARFDGVAGTRAVMEFAVENRRGLSAEDVQAAADEINGALGRFDPARRHLLQVEIPNSMFTKYLYESLGIELALSAEETDRIFWDAAAPAKPSEGAAEFLDFLFERKIRTAVLSNISYCGKVFAERIGRLFPNNHFEFLLPTSEYMFRKPDKRIFDLALEKAQLSAPDVWFAGDNFRCDVEGAKNAGLFPVWYLGATKDAEAAQGDATCGGGLRVKSWAELAATIRFI